MMLSPELHGAKNIDDNTKALIGNGCIIQNLKNENVPIKSYSAASVKGG